MIAVIVTTTLGPMGVVESSDGLRTIRVGHNSPKTLRGLLLRQYPQAEFRGHSSAADLLERYARGTVVRFEGITLDDRHLTPFRRDVTRACRGVGYGRTATYADLALAVGNPRASRAIGRAMATNEWAIVVPCHRILRSDGTLGGYSAPQGIVLKQRLLRLEAAHPPPLAPFEVAPAPIL